MIDLFTKQPKAKGFTLIELLVVVSIIGLLASIVVVSLGGSRVQSRDAKRTADLRQIQQALELCYNDLSCATAAQNDYPVMSGTCAAIASYMAQAPVDPINSSGAFEYKCFSSASTYCLSAKMEGTTDWVRVRPDGTLTGQTAAAAGVVGGDKCSAA